MASQLFEKFSKDIIRAEYRHFQPTTKLNLNVPNKKTTFLIDFNDNFTTKNFEFYIAGEYKHADDNQNYGVNANVKMIDNFVPHLFSYIDVKKHNKLIDEVDYPGITSTIKQSLVYTLDSHGTVVCSGYNSRFKGGGKFYALGKLSELGLGFFEDVNLPIFKGGFEINFTRNIDNDALYRWKTKKADGTFDDGSLPYDGKVVINEFYLRVPIMEYEDSTKIQLLKTLEELSSKDSYDFTFRSWQCIQHKNVTGKTLNFDITNIYRNFNEPLFALVAFQTDKSSNQLKDNSDFDHANVKNIYVEVNGKRYPEELTDLNFDDDDFYIAYNMFLDYRRIYLNDVHGAIHPDTFKNEKPIYAIDLTKQPIHISSSKSNIVLHVDFNKNIDSPNGLSEGTLCYVVILSHKSLRYDIIKNSLKEY